MNNFEVGLPSIAIIQERIDKNGIKQCDSYDVPYITDLKIISINDKETTIIIKFLDSVPDVLRNLTAETKICIYNEDSNKKEVYSDFCNITIEEDYSFKSFQSNIVVVTTVDEEDYLKEQIYLYKMSEITKDIDKLKNATINTLSYNTSDKNIEELKKQMKSLANDSCSDYEIGHEMADRILCELLCKLGYEDLVNDWNKVGKWYG